MKSIKLILYKTLGLRNYLRLVSKIYILFIKSGFGKNKYPELHYLKKIIKPGFYCIDIGANLGYYSVFLSKFSEKKGKVYAVEPVKLFAEIWKKNTNYKHNNNLHLFNYALGASNSTMSMGLPLINGVLHHGMTKLINDDSQDYVEKFNVEMKIPDVLFADIPKIDFVKVDVEGYESIVFENMQKILSAHNPLIQSELSGHENRRKVISILKNLNYKVCVLSQNELVEIDEQGIDGYENDFYFVPGK